MRDVYTVRVTLTKAQTAASPVQAINVVLQQVFEAVTDEGYDIEGVGIVRTGSQG